MGVHSQTDLAEKGKGDVVLGRTKLLDVGVIAGFLIPIVIARKAQHHEAFILVILIQFLESGILPGVAALARHIDHEDHVALPGSHRSLATVNVHQRDLHQIGRGGSREGGK